MSRATTDAVTFESAPPDDLGFEAIADRTLVAAFDAISQPVVLIRLSDDRIVWANAAMRNLLGIERLVAPLDLRGSVVPEERAMLEVRAQEFRRTGEPYTTVATIEHRARRFRVALGYRMVDEHRGTTPRYVVNEIEVFPAPDSFASPRVWYERWPQPIAVFGSNGDIVFVNDAIARLLGYESRYDLARLIGEVLADGVDVQSVLADLRTAGNEPRTVRVRHRDGSMRRWLVSRLVQGTEDADLMVTALEVTDTVPSGGEVEFPDGLSKREREIEALLLSGYRVDAIANRLFVSPYTVRNHLRSMFLKLGVNSQAQLVDHLRARR